MATNLHSSPPNKRPKTLPPNSQFSPSKGKSKLEEELPPPIADDESSDCCGICLSEAGVSRGQIECCDHYYCFVCIMEWAKVESKCPLCKRRFSTIRRPPKPPIFPSERVVCVPIRDQVDHYFGNATTGPPELYSEVKCGMCQGTSDESFLLLCDLCDSAAHTYCLGLGYTVPEGDWFCQDCTLLKDERVKSERVKSDSDVQASFLKDERVKSEPDIDSDVQASVLKDERVKSEPDIDSDVQASVLKDERVKSEPHSDSDVQASVLKDERVKSEPDIDSDVQASVLKDERVKSEPNSDSDVQMSFLKDEEISTNEHVSIFDIVRESHGHANQRSGSASSDPCYSSFPTSTDGAVPTSLELKPNARTLQQCRNVHDRIRVLRQNWNGFRSGAFHFSSNRGEGSSSSDVKNDTRDPEIQKAWKMFDKAKSNIVCRASKCPIKKLNPIKSSTYGSNRQQVPLDSKQNGGKNVGSMGAIDHNRSLKKDCYDQPSSSSKEKDCYDQPSSSSKEKDCYEQPSSSSGKGMLKLREAKDVTYCRDGLIIGQSPAHQEFGSSKETSLRPHNANARSVQLPAKETLKRQHCLGSDASGTVVPDTDQVKGVNHMSSSNSKVKRSKEKRESETIYIDSQKYNDAKSEIQSLVKLNLKLQTKEEKLEVDAFKEVARLATHAILGACGLEKTRPCLFSIPGIICSHPTHIQQDQKPSLMPSSCRECFYAFVKDVVNSILLQKNRTQKNI